MLAELEVDSGPYQKAYRLTANGPVNWYFANKALWFFVEQIPEKIRDYLNLYLRWSESHGWIAPDIDADLKTILHPDSHDAYAATFMRLAVEYWRYTDDDVWWNENSRKVKQIAFTNILNQQKPNGLVRVFQSPHSNDISYLMDQCEVYAALADLARRLMRSKDPDAYLFQQSAQQLAFSIDQLFDWTVRAWRWADVEPRIQPRWYPDVVAQIFPHHYGVVTGTELDRIRFESAYEFLNQSAPRWWEIAYDPFPWLMIGYYAASKQNDTIRGAALLDFAKKRFLANADMRGYFNILEIGFAFGIERALLLQRRRGSPAGPAVPPSGEQCEPRQS